MCVGASVLLCVVVRLLRSWAFAACGLCLLQNQEPRTKNPRTLFSPSRTKNESSRSGGESREQFHRLGGGSIGKKFLCTDCRPQTVSEWTHHDVRWTIYHAALCPTFAYSQPIHRVSRSLARSSPISKWAPAKQTSRLNYVVIVYFHHRYTPDPSRPERGPA